MGFCHNPYCTLTEGIWSLWEWHSTMNMDLYNTKGGWGKRVGCSILLCHRVWEDRHGWRQELCTVMTDLHSVLSVFLLSFGVLAFISFLSITPSTFFWFCPQYFPKLYLDSLRTTPPNTHTPCYASSPPAETSSWCLTLCAQSLGPVLHSQPSLPRG